MTLLVVAVSRQKKKASVSEGFYVINLNGRQSGQANDSASIVKRAKKRFSSSEMLEEAQQGAKWEPRDYRKSLRVYTNSFCLQNTGS